MITIAALKNLLDNLEEGVVFVDAQRRVVEINAAAGRLLGRDGDHLLGTACPTLFAGTRCARECLSGGRCSLVPGGADARKVQDISLRRPDGTEIALRMWAMLLPANDAGLHCSIVLRDRSREVALEAEVRERWRLGALVGRAPAMQALYAQLLRAAVSDASVLVTGESGVGKELVARALHDNSPRAHGPFVPLDCGALPENLLESELFGHAKGAFSGAAAARVGRFEAANGGTLLLDEIGEISPAMQTKLLRVLQEREVVRLGENHPRKVDVRVVAATHRDLDRMVEERTFRKDLYYRLRGIALAVPPLRERGADIPHLVERFYDEATSRAPPRITRRAMDALLAYAWPGNVRELRAEVHRWMVLAPDAVDLHDLSPEIRGAPRESREPQRRRAAVSAGTLREAVEAAELAAIERALDRHDGNLLRTAKELGIERGTLKRKLRTFGLYPHRD